MDLDFSKLMNMSAPQDDPRSVIEDDVPQEYSVTLTRQRDDYRRMSDAYKRYQDNIKKSSCIREEILKGLQAGEDPKALLLKACEAIARMTGDMTFYSQAEKNIQKTQPQ